MVVEAAGEMRLAICHPYLSMRGGAEKVVLKIAQHFNAKIYCAFYEPKKTYPELRDCDIEVLGTRLQHILPSFLPIRVRRGITAGLIFYTTKLSDYDVINAQGTPGEWIRHRNSPVVWYSHSPNRDAFDLYELKQRKRSISERSLYWACIQAYRRLEGQTVPKLEHIFANSANTQGRLKRYFGVDSEILHPGIDVKDFRCEEYQKYFLYPSRIAPEKRFEYAIDAFRKFRRNGHGDWKLVIAGALFAKRPEHVAYYEWLKGYLGDDGKIVIDLPFEQLVSLYANAYAVLYTPINEDFGIVPLEALASCKPVIAVNEGGPREVVVDGENGFLVNSPEEMAARMEYLAAHPDEVEGMGRSGRRHVERNFSWERFLSRFGEVCRKLARRG